MKIIQILVALLLVTSVVSAQSLKSGSVTDTLNIRNEGIRLIKKMSLSRAFTAMTDSLYDVGYHVQHTSEEDGFLIDHFLPCINDGSIKDPLPNMPKWASPGMLSSIRRGSYLPKARLKGKVTLEKKGEDVLIRATFNKLECAKGGLLPNELQDFYSTFWSNVSASLFIDGIKLSAAEVN
jgi:hypothetical protein